MFVRMHVCGPRRVSRAARRFAVDFERSMRDLGDELETMAHDLDADLSWTDADWGEEQRERRGARREKRRRRREERHQRWTEHRQARRERKAERAERRSCARGSCGWAGMWWLVFPIVFAGGPLLETAGEMWSGVAAGLSGALSGLLGFTFAGPIASLISGGLGMSFLEAFALLGSAAAAAGAAAWLGLRLSAPQPSRRSAG